MHGDPAPLRLQCEELTVIDAVFKQVVTAEEHTKEVATTLDLLHVVHDNNNY